MKPQTKATSRKWPRRLGILLIGMVSLFLLTIWLLLPVTARLAVPGLARDFTDGQISLGWVWVNPVTSSVTVSDFSWTDPGGDEIIEFSRLRLDFNPLESVMKREWRMGGILMGGLRAEILIDEDGGINLLEALKEKDTPAHDTPSEQTELPVIGIGSIQLRNAALSITDLSRSEPFRKVVTPIDFTVADLYTGPGRTAPVTFNAATEEAEQISIEGTVSLNPLDIQMHLSVSGARVHDYSVMVLAGEDFRIGSGVLDAEIGLSVSQERDVLRTRLTESFIQLSDAVIRVSGQTTHANASLSRLQIEGIRVSARIDPETGISLDAGGRLQVDSLVAGFEEQPDPFLNLNQLRVEAMEFALQPMSIRVGEIVLSQPAFILDRLEDGSLALAGLLPQKEATAEDDIAKEDAEEKPLPSVRVESLLLQEGSVILRDASVEPNTDISISPIAFTAEPVLLSDTEKTQTTLSAEIQGVGHLKMEGAFLLPQFAGDSTMTLSIEEVPLPVFSPYGVAFTGRPIETGSFSGAFSVTLMEQRLDASNELRVQSIRFGSQVPGYEGRSYPLETVIGLLENSNGLIELQVPVSGSLNDPSFNPFGAFTTVLQNLFLKAATAPVSIATNMTGGVLSGIGSITGLTGTGDSTSPAIDFTPGTTEFVTGKSGDLTALADTLKKRPHLLLEIHGSIDAQLDPVALDSLQFERLLKTFPGVDRSEKLREAYRKEFLATEALPPQPVASPSEMVKDPVKEETVSSQSEPPPASAPAGSPGFYLGDTEKKVPAMRPVKQIPDPVETADSPSEPAPAAEEPPTPTESAADVVASLLPDMQTITEALKQKWRASPSDLVELGNKRANRVSDLLKQTHGVPDAQLKVVTPPAQNGARVEFSIQSDIK